jgi:TetR/AcrR family transcriptional regulator, transcriptional repressor for nem operon
MRYYADHKARTRERVLKAACDTIRRDGLDALGVAGVMKAAGLTHGGFYAHFASRDDLAAAAIGEMVEGVRRQVARHVDDLPPEEGLARYLDFYLSAAHRDAREHGCPLPVLAGDMPRMEPLSRERFKAAATGLAARLQPLLEAMGHADADALAVSVVSEAVGALSLARAMGACAESDAILATSRAAIGRRIGLTVPETRQ